MSKKIENLAIEKAKKNKYIELIDFCKVPGREKYLEFYRNRGKQKKSILHIDFSCVNDEKIVDLLVHFIWDQMDIKKMAPVSFHTNIRGGIDFYIKNTPNIEHCDYATFLKTIANVNADAVGQNISRLLHRIYQYSTEYEDPFNPYVGDIWHLENMVISKERYNLSRNRKTVHFEGIANCENKKNIKAYIKYLLENTNLSISSIESKLAALKNLNYIDKSFIRWSENDADEFINHIKSFGHEDSTIAKMIMYIEHFTEFLIMNDIISYNPIKKYHSLTLYNYEFKESAVDDYVINQIFRCLGNVEDFSLSLCFLTIYCTGMRVSEACQLERDCLGKENEV